jgi:hypothetical protein
MALIRIFFLIAILMSGSQNLQAEETDQFTLPPTELIDIGPMVSQKLFYVLEKVIDQTNLEMQILLPKSKQSHYAASQLALRKKGAYLADLLYKYTGPGFPRWLRWKPTANQLYKETKPWKTVYWLVFSQSPLFVIGLAPTINMYGYYFGTDKLNHFFMQGHTCYKLYLYCLTLGKSPEQARKIMVTFGQILEQTYLGTMMNGVYSNADLAGNYAGWKFYMNLTQRVKIGNKTYPPIFVLKGNKWEFSKHINKNNLLRPYISDHLNEAFNPCRYSFSRSQIRKQVKQRCPEWIRRKHISPQLVETKLTETSYWHGENYGHWLPADNVITLNTCFGRH